MESTMMSVPMYVTGLFLTVLMTNWMARRRHERAVMKIIRRLNEASSSPTGTAPSLSVAQRAHTKGGGYERVVSVGRAADVYRRAVVQRQYQAGVND